MQRIVKALVSAVIVLVPALALAQGSVSPLAASTHQVVAMGFVQPNTATSPGGPGSM